jgi:hypothetical protein
MNPLLDGLIRTKSISRAPAEMPPKDRAFVRSPLRSAAA